MRVVYSDESGTGNIKQQPIAVVTAILLNIDDQWESIERELSRIKIYHIPVGLMHRERGDIRLSTLFQNPELKGDRLFKGLRGKIRDVAPEQAVEALTQILSVAVRNKVQIFYGAIDRAGYADWLFKHGQAGRSDESNAFLECLRRVHEFLHTHMPKDKVLWIADKSGFEKSVKSDFKFVQWLQGMGSRGLQALISALLKQKGETDIKLPDFNDSEIRPLPVIDTIYFGNSHESLPLQFADVCCATITQHLLGRQDAEPFYNIIRRQVVTDSNLAVYSNAWKQTATHETLKSIVEAIETGTRKAALLHR
jgi:Protein of unknown function (DUF3800)